MRYRVHSGWPAATRRSSRPSRPGDEAEFGRLLHAPLGEEHPAAVDQVRRFVWQRARRSRTTSVRFTDTELDEVLAVLNGLPDRTDVVDRVAQRLTAARKLPKGATRDSRLV